MCMIISYSKQVDDLPSKNQLLHVYKYNIMCVYTYIHIYIHTYMCVYVCVCMYKR